MRKIFLLVLPIMVTLGCDQFHPKQNNPDKNAKATSTEPHQKPTATEVFHLRSECSELGAKIMNENIIGRGLAQDQVSHYDPKTNRCYVQLTVQSADLSEKYYATYLHDGQTKEMLAFLQIKDGKRRSMAFHKNAQSYEQVQEYIDSMMEDSDYSK